MTSGPSSAVLSTPRRAHTHQELAEVRSKLPFQADRVIAVPHAAINCLARAVHEHARIEVRIAHLGLGQYHRMKLLWMASSSHKNGCATAIDAGVAPGPCIRLLES